jgi:hypothetical protein
MVGADEMALRSIVNVEFRSRSKPPSSTLSLRLIVERMPVTLVEPIVAAVPV